MNDAVRGLVLYGSKGVYAVLVLLAGVIVARGFGAQGFGQYSLLMTTLSLAVPIGSLGANYAMIEWVPKLAPAPMKTLASRLLSTVTLVSIALVAVVAVVLAAVAGSIWPVAWVLVPATLRVALIGYLQAHRRQIVAAILDGLVWPVVVCLGLILSMSADVELTGALALSLGGAYIVCTVVAGILLRHGLELVRPTLAPLRDREHRAGLFVFSTMALLGTVTSQIDRYFLAGFRDSETLAPYAAAQNLMNLVVYATTAAVALLLPTIAAGLAGKQPLSAVTAQSRRFARVVFGFSTLVLLFAIAFGPQALALFGSGFAAAHAQLIVLMSGLTVSLAFGFPMSVLSMTEHRKAVVWAMTGAALLTVVACLALIPAFGAMGAAIANALGMIASRAFCHTVLLRRTGLQVSIF